MRSRVWAATGRLPLRAWETVVWSTPASRATSVMVTFAMAASPGGICNTRCIHCTATRVALSRSFRGLSLGVRLKAVHGSRQEPANHDYLRAVHRVETIGLQVEGIEDVATEVVRYHIDLRGLVEPDRRRIHAAGDVLQLVRVFHQNLGRGRLHLGQQGVHLH